jgi:peptidylprolyl isomerase
MHKLSALSVLSVLIISISILAGETGMATSQLQDGMYASFKTAKGEILCKLEFEKTP